ncbi:MAG: HEAT repeat domain-containing protein, partial [Planctomycetaceae bacterium]|nr:HEAT repeat domain-containing protein [Planctomycetaceae bacterium]
LRVDTYVALLELLEDNDGFVVSKAVEGLKNIDMPLAVEPLLKVIERSPDLASHVIKILVNGTNMRAKAIPRLQAFCRHDDPRIRAAVIENLGNLPEEDIVAGINDTDSRVRIASAKTLFRSFEVLRMQKAVRNTPFQELSFSSSSSFTWSNVVKTVVDGLSGPPSPDDKNITVEMQPDESPIVQSFIAPTTIEPTIIGETVGINVDPFDLDLDSSTISATSDQWLLDFYQGKGRPDWMTNLIEPLEKMRSAESLEEQIVAAAALVPLGKSEETVPFLMEVTKDKPEFFDSFREVVPWLVWEKRLALFHQWLSLNKPQDAQIAQFLECFINPNDPRCEAVLWEILGEENVSMPLVNNIYEHLKPFYMVNDFSNNQKPPSKKIRDGLVDKLLPRINTGPENQRLIATAMLVTIDMDKAYEVAERLDADSSLSDEFRRDMFQVKLLSQTNEKLRMELAVETLKQKDMMRSRLALLSLVDGPNALSGYSLREHIYLTLPYSLTYGFNRRQDTQQLPRGLELEWIKPLIDDDNEEIAAYSGYLAVLLGDSSGMEPLLKYWRKIGVESDASIRVLVSRAIASLDDPQYIPVLREIYDQLRDYNVRDFYWTIRSMTGPEILKLRKEIRDKYGMETLR